MTNNIVSWIESEKTYFVSKVVKNLIWQCSNKTKQVKFGNVAIRAGVLFLSSAAKRGTGDVGDKRRNETQILSSTKNVVVVVVVTEGVETSLKNAAIDASQSVEQKNP